MSVSDPLRARLSGPAARFVFLLRDFGHFDDAAVSRLVVDAAGLAEGSEELQVDLAAMRRLAAAQLFEQQSADLMDGRGILAEDWPLLFS